MPAKTSPSRILSEIDSLTSFGSSSSSALFLSLSSAISFTFFEKIISFAGRITASFKSSFDLWVALSNVLILSISSPKNSILTGAEYDGGKISKIPPATLISPFSSTKPVLE